MIDLREEERQEANASSASSIKNVEKLYLINFRQFIDIIIKYGIKFGTNHNLFRFNYCKVLLRLKTKKL